MCPLEQDSSLGNAKGIDCSTFAIGFEPNKVMFFPKGAKGKKDFHYTLPMAYALAS